MSSVQLKNKKVVCYGEVLWDIFPDKSKPGGAPMNVAYHLKKFGIHSQMISRVGKDTLGEELTQLLESWGIPTEYVQKDATYPTGKVEAIAGDNHEMSYIIHTDVAWDNIQVNPATEQLVEEADAFVFGTLATRSETSLKTLYRLLSKASYKVFDINLRPPFYSKEIIEYLLIACDLLKLNESEVKLLTSWYSDDIIEETEQVEFIQNHFNIDEIIVTKGGEGATYYNRDASYTFPAVLVTVKDTVGSGDSFLAAFLANKIKGNSIETAMTYATSLGAFVASNEGACPNYSIEQIEQFAQINVYENS